MCVNETPRECCGCDKPLQYKYSLESSELIDVQVFLLCLPDNLEHALYI